MTFLNLATLDPNQQNTNNARSKKPTRGLSLVPKQSAKWTKKQELELQAKLSVLFEKHYPNRNRILRHLMGLSATTGITFISKTTIARDCDCSVSTAKRVLRELKELELIFSYETIKTVKPFRQSVNVIMVNWFAIDYFPGRLIPPIKEDFARMITFKNPEDRNEVNAMIEKLNARREKKVLNKKPDCTKNKHRGGCYDPPGIKINYELKTCMYILKSNINDLDERLAVLAEIITSQIEEQAGKINNLERWREKVATAYYNALLQIKSRNVSILTIERYVEEMVNDPLTKWVWGHADNLVDRFFSYLKTQEFVSQAPKPIGDPSLLPPALKAYQATLIRWIAYLEEKTGDPVTHWQVEVIVKRMQKLSPSDFRESVEISIAGGYRTFLDKLYKRRINGRPETDIEETQRLIREKDDEKFEIAVDSKTSLQLEEQRLDKVQDKLIKLIEKLQADEQLVEEIMKIAENSGLDKALEKAEHLIKIMKL